MSEEKENGKTKQCKYCKQEIDAKAKICPHCRKKQTPSGCLIAVIAVVVIIVIAIAGSAMSGGEKTNTSASTDDANSTSAAQQEITYTASSFTRKSNDLVSSANSLRIEAESCAVILLFPTRIFGGLRV